MFQSRVKLLSNPAESKNASISIGNMQEDDTGMYTCEVDNIPDVEGKNEQMVFFNVLGKSVTKLYINAMQYINVFECFNDSGFFYIQ